MRIGPATWAYALLTLSLSAGCGGKNPVAPTAAPGVSPSPSQDLTNALSVTDFSLQGWRDGSFHYLPTMSVSVPPTGGSVTVQRVDFATSNSGATTHLTGVVFVSPPHVVSPGGTLNLFNNNSPMEIISPVALASITATVSFTSDAGQTGTVAITENAPLFAPDASSAALVIRAFSVVGSSEGASFGYWPKVTLAETSGVSPALIKKMTFELVDVGPPGRIPPSWEPREVPAGGSITLDEDDYGGPWLWMTSMADASRVSLTISFVDDAGRGGSVTAIAPVSR
jgi:hypothetical protein